MDYLEYFYLINVQSHENSVFHFNRTGVHRISGENSDGKSVIAKAFDMLFKGKYLHSEDRETMIRDNQEAAVISATAYNQMSLTLFLHRIFSKCYYEIEWQGDVIRKYLGDDYKSLIRAANFHYDAELDFSLNIYRTKTTLPFVYTSGSFNYKILETASEVPAVRRAIEELKRNLSLVDKDKDTVERKIIGVKEMLKTLEVKNTERMKGALSWAEKSKESYGYLRLLNDILKKVIKSRSSVKEIKLIDYSSKKSEMLNLRNLHGSLHLLKGISENRNKVSSLKTSLSKDPAIIRPSLLILSNIKALCETSHRIIVSRKVLKDNKLLDLPEFGPSFDILNKLKRLTELTSQVILSRRSISDFDSSMDGKLKIINSQISNLRNFRALAALTKDTHFKLRRIEISRKEVNILDLELQGINRKIGICPKCGGKININRHKDIV